MAGYTVKAIFPTLQGEGFWSGTPAVFVRLAGCNLWTGREPDRARGAAPCARFCDTDFVGGEPMSAEEIAGRCVDAARRGGLLAALAVVTGGEPALQIDRALCDALRDAGFRVAVETNGTVPLRCDPDWICVSPKRLDDGWVEKRADEIKVVVPGYHPGEALDAFRRGTAPRRGTPRLYVQPEDGRAGATAIAAAWVRAHPEWSVSVQAHKLLGLP